MNKYREREEEITQGEGGRNSTKGPLLSAYEIRSYLFQRSYIVFIVFRWRGDRTKVVCGISSPAGRGLLGRGRCMTNCVEKSNHFILFTAEAEADLGGFYTEEKALANPYTHISASSKHKTELTRRKYCMQNVLFFPVAVPSQPVYTSQCFGPLSLSSHKLSRSKLNRSPLLSFLTMPNLKYLSSPLAVFPPTYHFSPRSLKPPSLLVSLPLLALLKPPLVGGDMACGLLDVGGGGDLAADGEVEA